jgi:hypothetical protein
VTERRLQAGCLAPRPPVSTTDVRRRAESPCADVRGHGSERAGGSSLWIWPGDWGGTTIFPRWVLPARANRHVLPSTLENV